MDNFRATLNCYAKINLFLEVLGQRSDGYHNIGTLFQTINCFDRLSAESCTDVVLEGGENITRTPEENLIIKAAKAVKRLYQVSLGIKFHLQKNLPVGAGLGGGSSNAAAALKLCNQIWQLNILPDQLHDIAAQLGSDVPFLLHGGSYFATGTGDILVPAPFPHRFHVVIATPQCMVDTADAYGKITPNRSPSFSSFQNKYLKQHKNPTFYSSLKNDFEQSIYQRYPQIRELYNHMNTFNPVKVLLCGSGASVFGLFIDLSTAESCESAIRKICRFSCVSEFHKGNQTNEAQY
jgi:4-diphosphocytidyl-2-C-methyl-D-erythritol kinase